MESMDLDGGRAGRSLWRKIVDVALMDVDTIIQGGVDRAMLDRLERVLLEADFGVDATLELIDELERAAERGKVGDAGEMRAVLAERIRRMVTTPEHGHAPVSGPADADAEGAEAAEASRSVAGLRGASSGEEPSVVLLVGVNGTGKTTTAGKLAHRLIDIGEGVLLAATDTFRAGAQDQLRIWAGRVGAEFVGGQSGGDPASVAFDAVEAARHRGLGWVIVDTAGRLHTQGDLMEELRKVERVVRRKVEGGPHECLLVVDATSGQNVLTQARRFAEALELSGLVLAKFDSTARSGTVVSVVRELGLPVRFLGTGEGPGDLEPFDAEGYVGKILDEKAAAGS